MQAESENKDGLLILPDNLELTDTMEMQFQSQIAPDFSTVFTDQFQIEKEKTFDASQTPTMEQITQLHR